MNTKNLQNIQQKFKFAPRRGRKFEFLRNVLFKMFRPKFKVMESQTREASDDDIVQALNHYTKALQDALRIANSS